MSYHGENLISFSDRTAPRSLAELLAATKISQLRAPLPNQAPPKQSTLARIKEAERLESLKSPGQLLKEMRAARLPQRTCLRCRIEPQVRCALCASWISAKYPSDARLKYAAKDRSYLEFLR